MIDCDFISERSESCIKNEEIGKRVRELRDCKGLTQEQLANLLNVSHRHVAHIEAGTRGLTLENAEIMADNLFVTLDYIYRGKTSIDNIDPVCQLILQAMSKIKNVNQKDFYFKTIIELSHMMISLN